MKDVIKHHEYMLKKTLIACTGFYITYLYTQAVQYPVRKLVQEEYL